MNPECVSFRENFEQGDPAPHAATCPGCRAFAEAVDLAGSCGLDLPLPEDLAGRLAALGATTVSGTRPPQPALAPLPQMRLPEGLRERLRTIPASGRRPLPAWVTRSGDILAAASLAALLLTALLGRSEMGPRRTADEASRGVGTRVHEAGILGTGAILAVGEGLSLGMREMNGSMAKLAGLFAPRPQGNSVGTSGKDASVPGTKQTDKESAHGNRRSPRNRSPRG